MTERLLRAALRFLRASPKARRLGHWLPRPLQRLATSLARSDPSDPRARELERHVAERLLATNRAQTALWREIRTRADWERFRDARLHALLCSLGRLPSAPTRLTPTADADILEDRSEKYYRAANYLADHPEASLREVGRAVGVSKDTIKLWKGEEFFCKMINMRNLAMEAARHKAARLGEVASE